WTLLTLKFYLLFPGAMLLTEGAMETQKERFHQMGLTQDKEQRGYIRTIQQ
ncbi:hypothetical protein STEG23_024485, partial [Scotinomys teguina]